MSLKVNYKEAAKFSVRTALIVGIILTLINHYRVILDWSFSLNEASTWLLNFAVPFIVSFYSRVMSERKSLEKKAIIVNENQELKENLEQANKKLEEFIEQSKNSQREEQKRSWKAEGIAHISSILREKENDSEIFYHLISALVEVLKVNQAGIFLTRDDGQQKHLELVSMYAYDRKKYLNKEIEIGHGLVGQCYLEKKYIHLTEIPDEYISIQSGLGDAPPNTIFIQPVMQNEEVEGIIELASFQTIQPHEIEFLNEVSSTIASFITNNRINDQTKELLEVSQKNAEELRLKEEQMRQSLEELEATQEDMSRKESEREDLLMKLRTGIVEQSLKEIKVNIDLGIKNAVHEADFLVEVPPVAGMIRASENNGYDEVGNSSYEEWLSRFRTIIENLMQSKRLYQEIALTDINGHMIYSSKSSSQGSGSDTLKDSFISYIDKVLSTGQENVYAGNASPDGFGGFYFIFGKPIYQKDVAKLVLFVSAKSDQIQDLIRSKEDDKNRFVISDSLNRDLYGDKDATFMESISETVAIRNDYNFTITHYDLRK